MRSERLAHGFQPKYLQNLGFTNLIIDSDPEVLTKKLMTGKIDAFVCTDITFPSILDQLGYNYTGVTPSFSLMSSDFYIAFSKTTPTATVAQWQSTLDAVKSDGTYTEIGNKTFPLTTKAASTAAFSAQNKTRTCTP
ncbi:MAG: transporter substrate-binding domain-containing protein [Mangrovibacterium sp.]